MVDLNHWPAAGLALSRRPMLALIAGSVAK
jgi:hypothetical protein